MGSHDGPHPGAPPTRAIVDFAINWEPVKACRLYPVLRIAAIEPLGLSATACVTTNFTQPVASFQQSVNSSSASIGTYFQELNSLERTLYFADLATDPAKRLEAIDKNGKPTGLTAPWVAIQPR